jgi:hypothetical protein
MTKDDIVKLAIEHTVSGLKFDEEGLLRFAKLVAEHEREACAKVVDAWSDWYGDTQIIAKAIRARGQA